MKVLLNDGMDEEGISLFRQAGIDTYIEKRGLEELIRDIPEFDALVVRSATKVTGDVISSGAKGLLKIIGRAGVGYDNIDVDAASEAGILVKTAPSGNSNSAAELALGLMYAVARHIPQAYNKLKSGIWVKKAFQGTELSDATLGVIGCGRIAQRLAELVRSYMNVIGYDMDIAGVRGRFPNSGIEYMAKEEVIRRADFLSIHTGGSDVVIGASELAMMKRTAYLINASRGGNVDENALYDALSGRTIAGAGFDVYVEEPKEGAEFTNRLFTLPNFIGTSHLGASTEPAQRRTSIEIAGAVINYLLNGDYAGAVNAGETVQAENRPTYQIFIHHRDEPGAFAAIDGILGKHGINIREHPSRVLGEDGKVSTVYRVHQIPSDEVMRELNGLYVVLRARL